MRIRLRFELLEHDLDVVDREHRIFGHVLVRPARAEIGAGAGLLQEVEHTFGTLAGRAELRREAPRGFEAEARRDEADEGDVHVGQRRPLRVDPFVDGVTQRGVVGGPPVALVERGLQAAAPFGVDHGAGLTERGEHTVAGVGDRDADPGLGAVGGPDAVALLERVALELEVVEQDEHVGGRDQPEIALPGPKSGLHQCDPRAVHVSPSAAESVDREV